MKTFVKVSNRSEVKTSANVLNKDGQPAKYVTLTLQKDTVRIEKHPLTGGDLIVYGLPTQVTENQWLEPCVTSNGTELRRGLIADALPNMHVEGDILRLGAADGIDPYTGSVGSQYESKTYTTTNQLFLGDLDQDSNEFQERVDKAVARFNAQMVAQGRVAVQVEA
ncbi:hypothetical protein Q5H92_14605 [Hymenobacter sp. M29]|uniref:Uncharacterized protein n=1 Tax=Hymenobacter mellowenesis TaxID=3063995 RepID=A0ABT9ACM4_9BACT|nr:hypothetical protein [Hymenobacter sp. M29]MDO7847598.1 hypothetical protein [Hymenobacter sp. M29]